MRADPHATGTSTILVVEDERLVARDLQQTLQTLGYHVPATAASYDQALTLAERHAPDLVLLDIRLEGERDGVDFANRLRQLTHGPVGLVYLTAYADTATLDRAKATEPLGYLIKPVKESDLRTTVVVGLHRVEHERRQYLQGRWSQSLLAVVQDATFGCDAGGIVRHLNPAAETLLGLSYDEIVGRPITELLQLAREQDGKRVDLEALRPGGRVMLSTARGLVPVRGAVAPLEKERTASHAAVVLLRDDRVQRDLEARLVRTDRNTNLGQLVAGVAHDVNTPLGVITVNAEGARSLLQGHPTEGEVLDQLDDIYRAALDIRDIVQDLALLTEPRPERTAVDPNVCAARALRLCIAETHRLARIETENGPVHPVYTSPTALTQLLAYLVSNAAQAASDSLLGALEIRTYDEDPDHVVIDVLDNGDGVDDLVRERLFEPFVTTRFAQGGVGLGLWLSRQLVDEMGGTLELLDRPEGGTCARVRLPRAPDGHRPAPTVATPEVGHLLFVDQEPWLLRAWQRAMPSRYALSVTTEGREALRRLEEGAVVDALVVDLKISDISAREFYDRLCKTRPSLAQRVLFLSAGPPGDVARRFLAETGAPCLYKPITLGELLDAVRALTTAGG